MELVDVLKYFGLGEYETKALLTLLSKGELTAKDIAELSGIPRTSVYDVMNALESKGLVESYGKPLKFRALESNELFKVISGMVMDKLDLLKRELSKVRREPSTDVKVYKGDAMLSILRTNVSEAKEKIVALLSYITDEMANILNSAKCRLIIISPNAHKVRGECYEFPRKEKFLEKITGLCHGILIFDDEIAMIVFMNGITLSVVGYDEGLVSFLKMLVNSLVEFFKDVKHEVEGG